MTFSPRAIEAAAEQIDYEAFVPDADGSMVSALEPRRSTAMYKAKRALSAALAVDGVALQGWRPIESAPKDGTPIIGGVWKIRWADSHRIGEISRCWYQPEFDAFISSCREMTLAQGYTFENGATRNLHSPVIEPISHWMPIPQPPAASDREGPPSPPRQEKP